MGSPLSPIVANLFMEKFEREALDSYPLKPSRWKRYVDDTNVVWPHGEDELRKFLTHLNSISPNIKFTMELEENRSIPFLDVLLTRKEDGTLGHEVFCKKTHTDSYLHADSHHHLSQKIGVLNTLEVRASRIADLEYIKKEKDHPKEVFTNIGYKPRFITKNLGKTHNKSLTGLKTSDNKTSTNPRAYLPYI